MLWYIGPQFTAFIVRKWRFNFELSHNNRIFCGAIIHSITCFDSEYGLLIGYMRFIFP